MVMKQYDRVEERERIFELTSLEAKNVLDLGTCGCECMSMVLAKHGFRVTAVDNSEERLREAQEYAAEEGLSDLIDFQKEDAAELSFEDGSFDAVVAYNLLRYCGHVEKVISEMFRVCKERGKIIVAELNAERRKEAEHAKDSAFLVRIEKLVRGHSSQFEVFDLDFTRVWVVRR